MDPPDDPDGDMMSVMMIPPVGQPNHFQMGQSRPALIQAHNTICPE